MTTNKYQPRAKSAPAKGWVIPVICLALLITAVLVAQGLISPGIDRVPNANPKEVSAAIWPPVFSDQNDRYDSKSQVYCKPDQFPADSKQAISAAVMLSLGAELSLGRPIILATLGEVFHRTESKIKQVFTKTETKIKKTTHKTGSKIKQTTTKTKTKVKRGSHRTGSKITGFFNKTGGKIKSFFNKIFH